MVESGLDSPSGIFPLRQEDAFRVRLLRSSRFSPATLGSHLGQYPHLAFWAPATEDYVVGGYWRGRREIGHLLETTPGPAQGQLVDRLVSQFQEEGCQALMLSPEEVDTRLNWYRERGWEALDKLAAYRQRLSRKQWPNVSSLAISPFRSEDLGELTTVDRAAFPWLWWNDPLDFMAYCSSPSVGAFMARDGNSVVGYVSYTARDGRGHLDRLAVHPASQGKGHGGALLGFALRRMAGASIREVALTTQVSNLRAQRFYGRFGFLRSGEVYPIYGRWLNDPQKVLRLSGGPTVRSAHRGGPQANPQDLPGVI